MVPQSSRALDSTLCFLLLGPDGPQAAAVLLRHCQVPGGGPGAPQSGGVAARGCVAQR